ncbi:MAG TPA: sulfatase-like hydrolase/transferase [Thermoanaerobaculia bacterium]|nr:sulfatase-like hydrolase/transferase [Thermoanaerobaculia bacterium]
MSFGCGRAGTERAARPPVILISIDTLRSDHLPAYGYRGVRTPAIDAFAREAIVFERAYSHSPLTLPSHATILTGRLPADTGIRDNAGFRLDPGRVTLAEVLKRNGYATGAAVSAYVLRADTGINRGFDFFDDRIAQRADQSLGGIQRSGVETESAAKQWLGTHAAQPFFLLLHLYEPHSPYDAPEPYRSQFQPYDAEIAASDAIVGRFLETLKAQGLYDRALIVLLSDHGEGLGDHGEDEHGIFLYRESIQVPLMVKLPNSARPSRVSAPVGLRDVMPAILHELDIALPPGLDARPIFREAVKPRPVYSETFYPRLHFGWSDLHSLIDGTKHFILAPRQELYDLASDPGETKNLAPGDRRAYAAMKRAIASMIVPAASPAAIAPEEAAKLAALGYIGGGATETVTLSDPKDERQTFRDLRSAFAKFRAGQDAEALAAFQKILRTHPGMTDVWDVTAKTYRRMGHREEAIAAAKEGLKTNPRSAVLATAVAELALEAGHLDEASRHAELVLQHDPPRAHEVLARIAMARGDLAAAEQHAKQAMNGGDRAAARVTLARVLKQAGRDAEALAAADEAARIVADENKPPFAGLAFLRGDLLARLGRNGEAEAAFRQEIALAPADARAYQSLIVLLVSTGRGNDATPLVFQLIERAPSADNYAAIVETMNALGDTNGVRYWAAKGRAKYPRDPRFRR